MINNSDNGSSEQILDVGRFGSPTLSEFSRISSFASSSSSFSGKYNLKNFFNNFFWSENSTQHVFGCADHESEVGFPETSLH